MNERFKLVGVLTCVTLIIFLGTLWLTPTTFVSAQENTIEALQTVILQLLDQIKTLQKEIRELKSEPTKIKPEIKFTKTLHRGESGDEVTELQEFLKEFPDIYPEGLVTGYFGPLTETAVQKLQEKHNIVSGGTSATTGYGQVGPKTRAQINSLLSTGAGSSEITPPGLLTAPGIQKKLATSTSAESIIVPTIATSTESTTPTTTPSGTIPAVPTIPAAPSSGGGGGGSATPATPATPSTPAEPDPEPTSTEDTETLCSDGIDNDEDSMIDLDDSDCSAFVIDTTPPIISNIQTTNIAETSATITWTTDELSDSKVSYALIPISTATSTIIDVLDNNNTTSHSIALSSLTASTQYYYIVISTDEDNNVSTSGEQSFTTAAPPPPTDTFGPWITNLSITPTSGSPGVIITYTVTAEDPDGVTNIINDIKYPGSIYYLRPNWNLGGATNGTQTFSETVDHGMSPTLLGQYVIETIRAADSLGNISTYYPDGTVENSIQSTHNLTIPSILIE